MIDKIRRVLGKHKTIAITFNDERDRCLAYVLGISRSLAVLQEVDDLCLNGYKVLSLKAINEVSLTKGEKTQDKILQMHGIHEKVFLPFLLKYSNWSSLLLSLKSMEKCITVETKDTKDHFVMGEILKVEKGNVAIKAIDYEGRWIKKPLNIKFNDLISIGFDDAYSTRFHEYMMGISRKYCCERFKESVEKDKVIERATDFPDETEWYISMGGHVYFCPFCGSHIKGKGFGNYDIKEKRTKLDAMTKKRSEK